jgi:protein-S-isoprenylcysteine O-methyltransferase Ste14
MVIEDIVKILLSVIVISVFIGIFFFIYKIKVEKEIVTQQSAEIIKDFTQQFKTLLPSPVLRDVYNSIEPSLVAADLSELDEEVRASNEALVKKATRIIVIFVVIGLLLVALLCFIFRINPRDMIISTTITLLFVAIAEYIFVTYIVQNYSTIDSNFVRQKILNILANYR